MCCNSDLKTGTMRPGDPEDYIRIITPVDWKGLDAKAPAWEDFMQTIFDGDSDLVDYMHRLLGLSLVGEVREHIMPVLWGRGRNGKSTMFNSLKHVLGDHASPIPAETLLKQNTSKSGASHTADLFILKDRRLVWTSEISDGKYFDAATVKRLTGGDDLSARRCHGIDFEVIKQSHTLMMLTNFRPHVHDASDYALFQRLHLIPFGLSFVPDPKEPHERKADVGLENKLRDEASGILAWLVRGCMRYLEAGGLKPPQVILDATKEYQETEDVFGHFLEDCIEKALGKREDAGAVYQAYQKWCHTNGHFALSGTKFHKKMQEKFTRRKSGVYIYLDVVLVATGDVVAGDDF
ncbi:phage/plasmid primase, P4 family [uncultured Desulfobacter sp.]|uniref:DNA primase family protein n=1 Tax=uncultured Desulfobacter sp. TaxID=240139 RepID=UPI0029F4CAB3|nr:phage/plasmid primase, P4 family [uncultured Desulfobacter sp.]